MLVDARVMEAADDPVVLLNLRVGLQVDVGDAGGLPLEGEELGQVLLAVAGSADLPQAFPDGRDAVQHAVIIAEGTGSVAPVGLPDGGKPAAQEAAAAAGREAAGRPDKQGAPSLPHNLNGRLGFPRSTQEEV